LNQFITNEFCAVNAPCETRNGVTDCFTQIPDENCRPGARMCSADDLFYIISRSRGLSRAHRKSAVKA
jgi:hypothetical protein